MTAYWPDTYNEHIETNNSFYYYFNILNKNIYVIHIKKGYAKHGSFSTRRMQGQDRATIPDIPAALSERDNKAKENSPRH